MENHCLIQYSPFDVPNLFSVLATPLLYIFQGYQGMVEGGENIVEATWASSSNIMQLVSYLCQKVVLLRFFVSMMSNLQKVHIKMWVQA